MRRTSHAERQCQAWRRAGALRRGGRGRGSIALYGRVGVLLNVRASITWQGRAAALFADYLPAAGRGGHAYDAGAGAVRKPTGRGPWDRDRSANRNRDRSIAEGPTKQEALVIDRLAAAASATAGAGPPQPVQWLAAIQRGGRGVPVAISVALGELKGASRAFRLVGNSLREYVIVISATNPEKCAAKLRRKTHPGAY